MKNSTIKPHNVNKTKKGFWFGLNTGKEMERQTHCIRLVRWKYK